MFQPADDEYFCDFNYNKSAEYVIPITELLINFRLDGVRTKKPCLIYAERMDFKGLLVEQLRLAEKSDQRRMYVTTVDSGSFHQLKQDQSLHVTFAGFIENLARMLKDCQAGRLELAVIQKQAGNENAVAATTGANSSEFQLQFVEMRSFKNLVHLCLPCRIAPFNMVLFYMSARLDAIQKKNASQEHQVQQMQQEIDMHLRTIEQLNTETGKLRENLLETTRNLSHRHSEEMQHLQESLRNASEQRHIDNERSQKTVTALQMQIEKLIAEKSNIQTEKIKEHKHSEMLNEELASTKSQVASLKEQIDRLHAEIASQKNTERKNEMHLTDARKHIGELQEKLKKYDKAKADIVAELEAEKKISQTKRQALEMAAEEISKANEIIMKQTQELLKLKKTISWRTEVALQQEKAIKDKDKLLTLREGELVHTRKIVESLRQEIPQQLESMRKFANTLEQKYSEQIKALREKLNPAGKENISPKLSTMDLVASRHK